MDIRTIDDVVILTPKGLLLGGKETDELEARIKERGGDRLHTDWGELPWRSYTDPSGNEFCVLPAPREG